MRFINGDDLWFILLPSTYFFIGELFFRGQSFGKGTFEIKTVSARGSTLNPATTFRPCSTSKRNLSITLILSFFIPAQLFILLFQSEKTMFARSGRFLHNDFIPANSKRSK